MARPPRRTTIVLSLGIVTILLIVAAALLRSHGTGRSPRLIGSTAALVDALEHAQPGGRIELAGAHFSALRLGDVHWATPVTIVGRSDESSSFDGISLTGTDGIAFEHVAVSGAFEARRSGTITIRSSHLRQGISLRDGVHDATIDGNRIDGGKFGIWIYSAPTEQRNRAISVRGNDIAHQSADNVQAGNCDDLTIVGNTIHDIADNADHNDGIQFMGGDSLVVDRNRIWGQDEGLMIKAERVLGSATRVDGARITNNLVHNERGAGMIVAGSEGTQLVNNTAADNHFADIHIEATNPGLRIRNNVADQIYGTGPGADEDANCVAKVARPGPHDVVMEPPFLDRTDYRVAPGPCAAAARVDASPPDDFTGTERGPDPTAGAWQSES